MTERRLSVAQALEHLRDLRFTDYSEQKDVSFGTRRNRSRRSSRRWRNGRYEERQAIPLADQILFYRCLDALKRDPSSLVVGLENQAEWMRQVDLMSPPQHWFSSPQTGLLSLINLGDENGPFWRGWTYVELVGEPEFEEAVEHICKKWGTKKRYQEFTRLGLHGKRTAALLKQLILKGMKLCDEQERPYTDIEIRVERSFKAAYANRRLGTTIYGRNRRHHQPDLLGLEVLNGVLALRFRSLPRRKKDSPGGVLYARLVGEDGSRTSFKGRVKGEEIVKARPVSWGTKQRQEALDDPVSNEVTRCLEQLDLSGLSVRVSRGILVDIIFSLFNPFLCGQAGALPERSQSHDIVEIYDQVYRAFTDFDLSTFGEPPKDEKRLRGRDSRWRSLSDALYSATHHMMDQIPMADESAPLLNDY